MKRLFIAVNVTPNHTLLKVYNDLQARCNKGKIKWVDAGLFHLTLKFLGETSETNENEIVSALHTIAATTHPFSFNLKGVGIFGSSYRPRIIRVNIEDDEQLIQLGNEIRHRLTLLGFPNDSQNFVPHLTLARIKQVQDKAFFQQSISLYKEVFFQKVSVTEFVLYESILHPKGPEYVVVEKYKFL